MALSKSTRKAVSQNPRAPLWTSARPWATSAGEIRALRWGLRRDIASGKIIVHDDGRVSTNDPIHAEELAFDEALIEEVLAEEREPLEVRLRGREINPGPGTTALAAGLGSFGGGILGATAGVPMIGSALGGALAAREYAPKGSRRRSTIGGGVGGALGPLAAAIGGYIGADKPDATRKTSRSRNPSIPNIYIKLEGREGLWGLVTRSAKREGMWQYTYFRADEPLGDIQATSPKDALREAAGDGMIVVETSGPEAAAIAEAFMAERKAREAWMEEFFSRGKADKNPGHCMPIRNPNAHIEFVDDLTGAPSVAASVGAQRGPKS